MGAGAQGHHRRLGSRRGVFVVLDQMDERRRKRKTLEVEGRGHRCQPSLIRRRKWHPCMFQVTFLVWRPVPSLFAWPDPPYSPTEESRGMLDLELARSVSTRLCAGIRGVFGVVYGVCGLFVRIEYLKADLRLRLILGCPHQNSTNQSRASWHKISSAIRPGLSLLS
ncbi:hypothetical protein BDP81DRAFT_27985 [Colletotrichum phormii]|uniref:Uncharacterized protein n=1 Tax=Colletotrichum phormii TaxID=359342 RepID=A0AAI9ZU90_9PEZI|nr:uncharacterized protein BDP81DRAFT_27985 [Colletotrichum phormii]KAK1636767.1 hypothetical protein BDP81DRAFT_27985 [Colletotrichum phormii]